MSVDFTVQGSLQMEVVDGSVDDSKAILESIIAEKVGVRIDQVTVTGISGLQRRMLATSSRIDFR